MYCVNKGEKFSKMIAWINGYHVFICFQFYVSYTIIDDALKVINTLKFQNTWTTNYHISKLMGEKNNVNLV